MSPYIVTTSHPSDIHEDMVDGVRLVVSSLDKARTACVAFMEAHGCDSTDSAHDMPESGGTIGPLWNGTMIGVEPSDPNPYSQEG